MARGLRMSLRFARGEAAGLGLSALAISWGVALVCAIQLANGAVLRAFTEVVDTMAGRAALQVVSGEAGLLPEELAAAVAAVPGVERALPVVTALAFTADDGGDQLTVYGVDVTDDAAEHVYGVRLETNDPLEFLGRRDSLAIARAFAAERGLAPGAPLTLTTPVGRRDFTVRGLLEAEGVARAYGGSVAVMDLYAAEAVFTRPGFVTGIDVVVERGAEVTRVAETIATRLPAGARVETPAQRQADLGRVTGSLRIALQAMSLFGLVAAFLITFNRLSTVFEARAWQLGVLRAVGVRAGVLWRELLKEALLLGAAGVVVGIPLGIALGRLLVPVIATTSALAYKLVAPEGELRVESSAILAATALGLATAVLAAALPAWRASRVALAVTIRSRGTEQPAGEMRTLGVVRWVMLFAVAAASVAQSVRPSATTGLAATGLVAVGTALAARPVLWSAGLFLRAACRHAGGPVVRLAVASLLRNPRRTALTVATLGVGLGCVVWFWTMAASFRRSLVATLTAAVQADLVLVSSHLSTGWVEAPVSEELLAEAAGVPGVAAVVGSRVVEWPYAGRRVAIEAIDARYFIDPDLGRWPLADERIPHVWESVARGEAAVVSANFVLHFGARVGATIVLEAPSGPLVLRIGGVTAAYESPAGTIQMSRDLFRRHWGDRQVNRVLLKAAPTASIATIRAVIARDLARRWDLRILSAGELIEHYATQVGRAFAPLRVLAVTVLLVTLLGVADTLLAGVLVRTSELGAARALGVRRAPLARMVVVEALLMGVLGLGLAMTAGLGLAVLWVNETLPHLLGWVLALHVPYREAPVLALLTVAVCVTAALLPARRAARTAPGLALRCD